VPPMTSVFILDLRAERLRVYSERKLEHGSIH
jgi:hypothetical protein